MYWNVFLGHQKYNLFLRTCLVKTGFLKNYFWVHLGRSYICSSLKKKLKKVLSRLMLPRHLLLRGTQNEQYIVQGTPERQKMSWAMANFFFNFDLPRSIFCIQLVHLMVYYTMYINIVLWNTVGFLEIHFHWVKFLLSFLVLFFKRIFVGACQQCWYERASN